jgi:hypothetical protein
MAKGGKRKVARKTSKGKTAKKSGKAKVSTAPGKAKRGKALGGKFTRYVLFVCSDRAEIALFKADRSAHIAAYERKSGLKFTPGQKHALMSGSDAAINIEIDIECAASARVVPYATHIGGGPLGGVGPTPPPPPPTTQ